MTSVQSIKMREKNPFKTLKYTDKYKEVSRKYIKNYTKRMI